MGTIRYCDKCGEQSEKIDELTRMNSEIHELWKIVSPKLPENADICKDCLSNLSEAISSWWGK